MVVKFKIKLGFNVWANTIPEDLLKHHVGIGLQKQRSIDKTKMFCQGHNTVCQYLACKCIKKKNENFDT